MHEITEVWACGRHLTGNSIYALYSGEFCVSLRRAQIARSNSTKSQRICRVSENVPNAITVRKKNICNFSGLS